MTHYNQSFVAKGGLSVTAAEDSVTNETYFPLFGTAPVGTVAIKASSTKLSFNPATGLLSAISFSGKGSAITELNASNFASGILPIARGGTGANAATGSGAVVLQTTPIITGAVMNGPGLTNPTSTNGTFTTPTINTPNVSNGTFSTPTLTNPTSNNGTFNSPTIGYAAINFPTINNATINNPNVKGSASFENANISGSLSVGTSITVPYVDGLALKASTLANAAGNGRGMIFTWTGQTGQPSWLWGGNDGTNMFVWNPANFSVAYAAGSGNTNAFAGLAVAEFVRRTTGNVFTMGWDGSRINGFVDGTSQAFRTTWPNVDGRPTDLGSFTNGPGYVQRYGNSMIDVGGPDNSGFVGRAIPNSDGRIRYLSVIAGGIGTIIDGQSFSWPINPSDESLKQDIVKTKEDSLSKIGKINFVSFKFNDVSKMMEGITRKSGVVAQQIEQIDSDWVVDSGSFKQLNTETLLTSALHAIQQLKSYSEKLEKRIKQLEKA